MRQINTIIVHCSDSAFGDAAEIKRWHTSPDPKDKTKPWRDIGYHFVVLNGARKNDSFNEAEIGLVETGRPVKKMGAHCLGDNADSIGVCLIGKSVFVEKQLAAAARLVADLRKEYNPIALIFGHCETKHGKRTKRTCPNLNMNDFRQRVSEIEKGTTNV